MLSAASGVAFVTTCQGFGSGLVGTMGVTLYDALGNTTIARSTSSIIEIASSGIYLKRITDSLAVGFYEVVWDNGIYYAVEELEITA